MTENEAIEKILYMGVGRSGLENESSIIAKALSELMEYRAIGTVEKFKHYKHMLHMAELAVDSFEREKTEIRNKAIDEFAERLLNCGLGDFDNIPISEIKRIAEQMKGEKL